MEHHLHERDLSQQTFLNMIVAPILAVYDPVEALDQEQRLVIPKHEVIWDDGEAPYLQRIDKLGKIHSYM